MICSVEIKNWNWEMFTKNLVGGLDSADLTAGGAGGGGYGKKEVVVFLRGGSWYPTAHRGW